MAEANTRPAIVVIPGSFSYATMYYPLVDALKALGYDAFVNNLPSATRHAPEEPASLEDDAVFFRGVIEKLADKGRDVVVVMHSYGGVVGSEAVKDVGKEERAKKGKEGGVVKLVYLTAVVLPVGASLKSENGDPPPGMVEIGKDGFMRLANLELVAQGTFPDLDFDKALAIAKNMPQHSALSFASELTYPGYKYIPASFIFCENDFIIPPDSQRKYIERIKEASGKEIDVHSINTGHGPNVSATDKVAEIVVEIAKSLEIS